jgi:peptidoglycan hydrolase-like protein with peptidoglycan-binding domain
LYKASLQPYPVDVSEYRMPELLIPQQSMAEGSDKKEAILRIQKMLNNKYNANLDLDGILGPLTRKSINKFMPDAKIGLADEPNKTTAVQGKKMKENFADGKKPGRKGLSKRVGIPKGASIAQLEKIAKSSSGEKRRMAQWQLNMKSGKNK